MTTTVQLKSNFSSIDFIIAVEDGTLTQEDFDTYAQQFVDSGVWQQLQGSWQRTVYSWALQGLVNL